MCEWYESSHRALGGFNTLVVSRLGKIRWAFLPKYVLNSPVSERNFILLIDLNKIKVLKSHWDLSVKDFPKLNYLKCSYVDLVGKLQERYIMLHLLVRIPLSNKKQIFLSSIKDDTALYHVFLWLPCIYLLLQILTWIH